MTADAEALVTVQNETTSHLWVVDPSDPERAKQISTGRQDGLNFMAWAGNGNLYFEAPDSSGDTQIWRTAADGMGRRQVTADPGLTGQPAICGDGRYLLFCSYRARNPHIWRSDLDGGNVRQLTHGEGEWVPSCSPDGAWLTYFSTEPKSRGVWRMPIEGGTPVRIWEQAGGAYISRDGKSVLVREIGTMVRIIPAGGGQPIMSFDRGSELGGSKMVLWSADGTGLLYVKTVGGVSNIWQRPINGGEPKQVTRFTSLRITAFAPSRDGKRLALARGSSTSDVVLIKDLK
jgi:Tol biopolymer transport system component